VTSRPRHSEADHTEPDTAPAADAAGRAPGGWRPERQYCLSSAWAPRSPCRRLVAHIRGGAVTRGLGCPIRCQLSGRPWRVASRPRDVQHRDAPGQRRARPHSRRGRSPSGSQAAADEFAHKSLIPRLHVRQYVARRLVVPMPSRSAPEGHAGFTTPNRRASNDNRPAWCSAFRQFPGGRGPPFRHDPPTDRS
jgi:hypothetical protein